MPGRIIYNEVTNRCEELAAGWTEAEFAITVYDPSETDEAVEASMGLLQKASANQLRLRVTGGHNGMLTAAMQLRWLEGEGRRKIRGEVMLTNVRADTAESIVRTTSHLEIPGARQGKFKQNADGTFSPRFMHDTVT